MRRILFALRVCSFALNKRGHTDDEPRIPRRAVCLPKQFEEEPATKTAVCVALKKRARRWFRSQGCFLNRPPGQTVELGLPAITELCGEALRGSGAKIEVGTKSPSLDIPRTGRGFRYQNSRSVVTVNVL